MKAWTTSTRGPIQSVLRLTSLPKPGISSLQPGQALVRVTHVSLARAHAAAVAALPRFTSSPWVQEMEFAGVVEAVSHAHRAGGRAGGAGVGDGVGLGSEVKLGIGSPVFGAVHPRTYFLAGAGTLAEFIVVPALTLIPRPPGLSAEEAAGLAGYGCAAVQMVEKMHVKTGDRVLVTAAASAQGLILVQVLRAFVGSGGVVVGTCSAASAGVVRGLGCDEVIDYNQHPVLSEYLVRKHGGEERFNAIIDVAGTDPLLWRRSPKYLVDGGGMVCAGNLNMTHVSAGDQGLNVFGTLRWVLGIQFESVRPVWFGGIPGGRRLLFLSGRVDQRTSAKVLHLVERGVLTGVVDGVFEMEDGMDAYEKVMTGKVKGRVVVHVQD